MPLKVIIVGAGIAGLSAAIALRRSGHQVHLYERSSMNNEVGAAINVPPNAIRFLTSWGLDPVASGFVKAHETAFLDPDSLETTVAISHERNRARYGGVDLWYAHRVDLHNAFKRMATTTDPEEAGAGTGQNPAATIHTESIVIGYVCIPAVLPLLSLNYHICFNIPPNITRAARIKLGPRRTVHHPCRRLRHHRRPRRRRRRHPLSGLRGGARAQGRAGVPGPLQLLLPLPDPRGDARGGPGDPVLELPQRESRRWQW